MSPIQKMPNLSSFVTLVLTVLLADCPRIVAVHGLGADPEHTWTQAVPAQTGDHATGSRRIHLLRDLLARDFPEARIMSFAQNLRWLNDAPVKTTEEIGKGLLEEIKAKRSRRVNIENAWSHNPTC